MIIAVSLAGGTPQSDRHQALMNEIEASVHLPQGAGPMSAYGRYYAYAEPGVVRAIFRVPPPPIGTSDGCSMMTENLDFRPCTKEEIAETKRVDALRVSRQVPAGQQRWLKSVDDLPLINDGGCSVITIEYSVSSKRFLYVACNGVA